MYTHLYKICIKKTPAWIGICKKLECKGIAESSMESSIEGNIKAV